MVCGTPCCQNPSMLQRPARRIDRCWSLLELVALSGFAIAQPLLSAFGTSPETFVYRDADTKDIVAFALLVAFGPPLALWGVEQVVGAIRRTAGTVLHRTFLAGLGGLLAVQVVRRALDAGAGLLLVIAVIAMGTTAWALRYAAFHSFLRLGAIATVGFVVVFLLGSSVTPLLDEASASASASTGRGGRRSAVLVVFDEWPTTSIIDRDGGLDTELYPSLARLAAQSTWYRNASSVTNSTRYAVPAILTGNIPASDRLPIAKSQPNNVFSLFAPTHSIEAFESVTALCAERSCGRHAGDDTSGIRPLVDDAASLYWKMVTPDGDRIDPTAQFVERPAVTARSFERIEARRRNLARAVTNRPQRFTDFLRSFRAGEPPTLHVLHLLLPHVPLRFLPSGLEYPAPLPEVGRTGDRWTDGEDAVRLAQQRAVLQAQYVDRLVGQLVDRLAATGLLETTPVIVTADHGIIYEQGAPSRALDGSPVAREHYGQLLWVPLFVHAPGQRDGEVSDANVMSIDVLPTLARLADVPLRWATTGRPAGDRTDPTKLFALAHSDTGGGAREPVLAFDGRNDLNLVRAVGVDSLLADGRPRWRPWTLLGRDDLVGNRLRDTTIGPSSSTEVDLAQGRRLQVDRRTGSIPAMIWGNASRDAKIAIAVNGRIVATAPTFGPDRRVAMMLPEFMLRDGANELRVFEVMDADAAVRLRPVRG
jgi:hypothetical protein